MNKKLIKPAKYMSLLLRHKPELENLDMDKYGCVFVEQLIHSLNITMEELIEIVNNDNKQRFSFNSELTKIRVNQGHSLSWIELKLIEQTPPDILYHGTSKKFLSSIYEKGIIKNFGKFQRNHVHLSIDLKTAENVGKRHGTVYILYINSKQMFIDGYKFYLSENNVWLTNNIPRKYISNLSL
jgi:putative RNA 2'-phosphotransferase